MSDLETQLRAELRTAIDLRNQWQLQAGTRLKVMRKAHFEASEALAYIAEGREPNLDACRRRLYDILALLA